MNSKVLQQQIGVRHVVNSVINYNMMSVYELNNGDAFDVVLEKGVNVYILRRNPTRVEFRAYLSYQYFNQTSPTKTVSIIKSLIPY